MTRPRPEVAVRVVGQQTVHYFRMDEIPRIGENVQLPGGALYEVIRVVHYPKQQPEPPVYVILGVAPETHL